MKEKIKNILTSIKNTVTDLSIYLDGSLYILMLVTLLSTSVLIGYGSYKLITDPHIFNLLYFGSAGISLVLHGVTKWIMAGTENRQPKP